MQNEQGTINKGAATARIVIGVCKIKLELQKAKLMKGFFNIEPLCKRLCKTFTGVIYDWLEYVKGL